MEVLKAHTESYCPECYTVVPATVVEQEGGVYLEKTCLQHGHFRTMIESDARLYRMLMNRETPREANRFDSVEISLTRRCNMECNICYMPKREGPEQPAGAFQDILSRFSQQEVRLAGGEPTCREDLPDIIRNIKSLGRDVSLITNGLRLLEKGYARRLKEAGLDRIHVPFYGFDDRVYEVISGAKLARTRLKILRVLKKAGLPTSLMMFIVKGLNDHQLRDILRFCLRHNSHIMQLRIGSFTRIGKIEGATRDGLFLSEIVKRLSGILGVPVDTLVSHSLKHQPSHAPCHLEIDLFRLWKEDMRGRNIATFFARARYTATRVLPVVGLRGILRMVYNKLRGKKRLLFFLIKIRAWPDKYTVDLGEMKTCAAAYVSSAGDRLIPFCCAIILNDKQDLI